MGVIASTCTASPCLAMMLCSLASFNTSFICEFVNLEVKSLNAPGTRVVDTKHLTELGGMNNLQVECSYSQAEEEGEREEEEVVEEGEEEEQEEKEEEEEDEDEEEEEEEEDEDEDEDEDKEEEEEEEDSTSVECLF